MKRLIKAKAVANTVITIALVALTVFAFVRAVADVSELMSSQGGDIMLIGLGFILLLSVWFFDLGVAAGAFFCFVSTVSLYKALKADKVDRDAFTFGAKGKIFAVAALLILTLMSPTRLSKAVYIASALVLCASFILDLVLIYKNKLLKK